VIFVLLLLWLVFPGDVSAWYCGGGNGYYTTAPVGTDYYWCWSGTQVTITDSGGETSYCCTSGGWDISDQSSVPCTSYSNANCPMADRSYEVSYSDSMCGIAGGLPEYTPGPKPINGVFVSGVCGPMCACVYGNCAGEMRAGKPGGAGAINSSKWDEICGRGGSAIDLEFE
jgi:hypothetical protein